jgi:phosphoribosylcarboxyaminoimidazole (NCAIR) mutase
MATVGIIMGSESDRSVMDKAAQMLSEFGVAHRNLAPASVTTVKRVALQKIATGCCSPILPT